MKKWILLTAIGVWLLTAASASAHHGFAAYWEMDKSSAIEGVVTEVKLVQPHPTMKVEVTDANGQKSIWTITSRANASMMVKAGWTAQTLPVGTKVRVEGNPSRNEKTKALAAGKITKLDDGSILSFGGVGGIPQG